MNNSIPLCLLRLSCRASNSWLSFRTVNKDLFLINPSGYFIELADGSLNRISPRLTFPEKGAYPVVPLEQVVTSKKYGIDAQFLSVPLVVGTELTPKELDIEMLSIDPLAGTEFAELPDLAERYILVRAIENGLLTRSDLSMFWKVRERFKTVGSSLMYGGFCQWEVFLGYCLDTRPASRYDPPQLRAIIDNREWELTGEIMHFMGKISRTQLEHVIRIKREGAKTLPEILVSTAVCKEEDIATCRQIQDELQAIDGEVALIGKLLLKEALITEDELQAALRTQETSTGDKRRLLGEILVEKGICRASELEQMLELQRMARYIYCTGTDSIESILVKVAKVPAARMAEAKEMQSLSRLRFGEILVKLGVCTPDDLSTALEIQAAWRQNSQDSADRLGEVLLKQGIIKEEKLEKSLLESLQEEKPLGRILVERNICTPEQIISVLIQRNMTRRKRYIEFGKSFQSTN